MPQFPCLICEKAVTRTPKVLCCDGCNKRVYTYGMEQQKYIHLYKITKKGWSWYFKECLKNLMSYINKTNNTLSRLFEVKEIISPSLDNYLLEDNQTSVELGKSTQNKSFLTDEQISYLSNNKNESLCLHLNISSLSYHRDNLS